VTRSAPLPRAWNLLALALSSAAACGGGVAPAASDPRTAVVLPDEARVAVRTQMRAMLSSVSAMLAGLARNDTAAIRASAEAGGMGGAADPALERLLPERWMELALGTHRAFDGVATAVRAGEPRDSVIGRLAALSSGCVACHATYRLGP
jgi:cytochrome c556